MRRLAVFLLPLLLVSCADVPPPRPIALDFSAFKRVDLDAEDLRIADRSRSMAKTAPYVGHLFSPTLTQAASQMADKRFQAVGSLGHALFVIKDASVIEQPIDHEGGGFGDLFTRRQASKYIGRIEVALEAQSPADSAVGMATATAVHAVTLPEDPEAWEKQEAYRTLLNGLMATLNKNLDEAIAKHFSRFVRKEGASAPAASLPSVAPTTDSALTIR